MISLNSAEIKATVNLQPGENTIYFSVTNSIGTIRSEDHLLTNPPASKPVITWAVPAGQSITVNSDMIIVEACIKSSTPLKEAQIYVNGAQWASETVFPAPQPDDCNYRFTKSVLLKEGDNNVIINAINFAGSEISERRTIRFQTGIADCQWEAVQVNTIVRQFEQVPENINIIILDACRDNPFKSWFRGAPQGFKMLNTVSGTFVSFATAEGTTAAEGDGLNGPFTEELVKQMVIPQSIFNVFVNTRNQVMKRTNNKQQPEERNKLTGDFWFKK